MRNKDVRKARLDPAVGWIQLNRPGQLGGAWQQVDAQRDRLFGDGSWRTAFRWRGRVISYEDALMLYEDAYLAHFENGEDGRAKLEWIVKTASDVYDNDLTNLACGTDYRIQEARTTHLQDICVRRCLIRLGREFEGDHLVEIRGHESEGYRLNPGMIPFHRPDLIEQPETASWWRPGSVESFWQANKVLAVKETSFGTDRILNVHLLARRGDELLVDPSLGVPAPLPRFSYRGEEPFAERLRQFCVPLQLEPGMLAPTSPAPIEDGSDVHVIWKTTTPPEAALPGLSWAPLARVRSSRLNPPAVRELLGQALRKDAR